MLEPIGEQVLCRLEELPESTSVVQLVRRPEPQGREATVLCASGDFQVGDRLIVSMRQALQVGSDLLVPYSGILARLA